MATEKQSGNSGRQREANGRFLPGHRQGFKPGQSGNPAGRPPRESCLSDAIWDQLNEGDNLEAIAKEAVARAKAGDFRFLAEFLDRFEGKVESKIELGGKDLRIVVERANASGS